MSAFVALLADASWRLLPAIGDDDRAELAAEVMADVLARGSNYMYVMSAALPVLPVPMSDDDLAADDKDLVADDDADLVADVLASLPCGDADMLADLHALRIPTPCRAKGLYVGDLRRGHVHTQHMRDARAVKLAKRDTETSKQENECVERAWNDMRLREADCLGDADDEIKQGNHWSFGGVIRNAFLQVGSSKSVRFGIDHMSRELAVAAAVSSAAIIRQHAWFNRKIDDMVSNAYSPCVIRFYDASPNRSQFGRMQQVLQPVAGYPWYD